MELPIGCVPPMAQPVEQTMGREFHVAQPIGNGHG